MNKNRIKPIAVVAMVLGAMVLPGCGKSEAPPIEKIATQYKQIVAGRYFGRHIEFGILKISNVQCKNREVFIICTVDATGDLSVRDSLKGTVDSIKLDDKNIELKFLNRDALRK